MLVKYIEHDRAYAQSIIPSFLEELQRWVNIDSGTFDKQGIDAVGILVRSRMEQSGFVVTPNPQSVYGDNLVGVRYGHGIRRLLLIGHIDTVYPTGDVSKRPFHIDNGRAYGPGIFDMKSGILAALSALDGVGQDVLDGFASITMICNSDEEIGSPGSSALIESIARDSDVTLVFEPTRSRDTVTVARKGIVSYTLTVKGLSAHAGVMPDAGRNAILELAHLIIKLQALHNSIPTVSVNVGGVQGGGRHNVVPDHAEALFEMRAANATAFAQAKAAVAAVIAEPRIVADTEVQLIEGPQHLPLEVQKQSRFLIDIASEVGAELGFALVPLSIGGASDGNTTGGMGIPTLDGLGLIGQNSHHPEEYIDIAAIPDRLTFIMGILRRLSSYL